ncbi:MAG TPA: hypothetical protein VLW52_01715 [Opitutaceae bacterium]|nr:hypothetical protein [Opitutaceae bacterium]
MSDSVHLSRSPVSPRTSPRDGPARRSGRRGATSLLGITGAAVLALAACATERGDKRKLLERVPPPQPILSAAASYDHGDIEVQTWLGPSVRLRKAEGGPEAGPGSPHAGKHRGPQGESSSTPSGSFGHVTGPFESGASDFSSAEIDEMYGRVNFQYILPPRLALTLTITNRSIHPITLAITEVNSLLGNFAPRPEQLVLAPGQQGSVDPMLSTFDNNFEELDLTLAIKCGEGLETQVLKLRRAPAAAVAPGKPAPN